MSRVIVKNLPDKVTADKIKLKFSEFGRVTDVQLKYTTAGKFRKFGFIGFETPDEATNALKNLDKTYLGTSRIDVQVCAELGDVNKPKSWSKYAVDSSAFQKLHGKKIDSIVAELSKSKKKKKEKKRHVNPELIESLKKYMDHPQFLEFLELKGQKDFVLNIIKEVDSKEKDTIEEESDEVKKDEEEQDSSLAFSKISDSEYLRLKTKGGADKKNPEPETTDPTPEKSKIELHNIKIRNLPYKAKKKDIKELLSPLTPASIRFMEKVKGLAYVGFKTEKEMRQALVKNKTFLSGKQLLINEVKDKIKFEKPEKWRRQEETLKNEECIAESGRIFLRNLPYTINEEELEKLFSPFGPVAEVILPIDKVSRQSRGYGIVTFLMPEHAVAAYCKLDGSIFHGRMLHLLPGKAKEDKDENENAEGSYKEKKEMKLSMLKSGSHNWNTLFLDSNAVTDAIAARYNCTREEVLTGDAAVRLALGETQIVNETKQFLEENGVLLDAFNQETTAPRSKTVILVKNLPSKTTVSEIRELFIKHGELGRVLLAPFGVTGIVEFLEPSEARNAFKRLAYSKFKHLPLYLEWAPCNTFTEGKAKVSSEGSEADGEAGEDAETDGNNNPEVESDNEIDPEPDTTLFVKNINFQTTDYSLKKHFESCGKVASVLVAKKKDTKKPGSTLSMGYGFVQYYLQTSLNEALKKLQNSNLDGHTIELKRSNKTLVSEVVNTRKTTNLKEQTGAKIIVRNIPFQATAQELEKIFKTFGELKFVRLPKKLVGTGPHRGFGFVEYLSKKDAKRAMKALCQSTHLFGRRLVLEWAALEDGVAELRKRTAQHFHADAAPKKKTKSTFTMEEENSKEVIGDDDDDDES